MVELQKDAWPSWRRRKASKTSPRQGKIELLKADEREIESANAANGRNIVSRCTEGTHIGRRERAHVSDEREKTTSRVDRFEDR